MNNTEFIFMSLLLVICCALLYVWETAVVNELESDNFIFFLRACLLFVAIDSF